MTENEAIKVIKRLIGVSPSERIVRAVNTAELALKEIQQYRAIGTVEEIKRMQGYSDLAKKHSTIGQVIDSCAEYEAIGTVEECREAREKQRAKKPILDVIYHQQYYCPNCEDFLARKNGDKPHHCICGQAIDWSDTD